MIIDIEKAGSWNRVVNAARWTANISAMAGDPSIEFRNNILMAQHSPIRMLELDIKIKGIPYCNAVHFVRHHIGVEKFQCTLRDDRNDEIDDRKSLPQDYPVNLWLACNLDALISISRKRLCAKADETTREIWNEVVNAIEQFDPVIAHFMVPECVYRSRCPEKESCGYYLTPGFKKRLDFYWSIIGR